MTAEEAAMIMMSGSSSASFQSLFDRIAALPAVYSFDIADGWRCEICEDTEKFMYFSGHRYNWDEEHPHILTKIRRENQLYFRMFYNEELYITASNGEFSKQYTEQYACNGTEIGELKKNISYSLGNFHFITVFDDFPEDTPPPANLVINIGCTYTSTIDGVTTKKDSSITIAGNFLWRDNTDTATYISYAKAIRKLCDECNKTE